jgi:hypothetical protein
MTQDLEPDPDPLVRGTDPGIRIHTKMADPQHSLKGIKIVASCHDICNFLLRFQSGNTGPGSGSPNLK